MKTNCNLSGPGIDESLPRPMGWTHQVHEMMNVRECGAEINGGPVEKLL